MQPKGPRTTVILDLDNTLIKTFDKVKTLKKLDILNYSDYSDIVKRIYILDFYNGETSRRPQDHQWGIKRPHLDYFLDSLFKMFELVIVWSAGGDEYVNSVVDAIFTRQRPHFIFTADHCLKLGKEKTKPIALLFKHEPRLRKLTDFDHIVMVDDLEKNYIYNKSLGLVIRPYDPEPEVESMREPDDHLLETLKYLKNRLNIMARGTPMRA